MSQKQENDGKSGNTPTHQDGRQTVGPSPTLSVPACLMRETIMSVFSKSRGTPNTTHAASTVLDPVGSKHYLSSASMGEGR